ncbi:MAG: hypothetical protein WEB85_17110 [Dongiaceae bacterium]
MSYVVFAFETGIFGYVLTISSWPPNWVLNLGVTKAYLGVFLVFVWLLTHLFLRWQLRKRRVAAIESDAATKCLRDMTTKALTNDDFKSGNDLNIGAGNQCGLDTIVDFLIPWSRAKVVSDVGLREAPRYLVKALEEQYTKGTGAIIGEWFVSGGSLILLLIIVLFSFF